MKDALNFVLDESHSKTKLVEIVSAKKQMVNGINYDITYNLENGQTWNVVVYRTHSRVFQ